MKDWFSTNKDMTAADMKTSGLIGKRRVRVLYRPRSWSITAFHKHPIDDSVSPGGVTGGELGQEKAPIIQNEHLQLNQRYDISQTR